MPVKGYLEVIKSTCRVTKSQLLIYMDNSDNDRPALAQFHKQLLLLSVSLTSRQFRFDAFSQHICVVFNLRQVWLVSQQQAEPQSIAFTLFEVYF
ncbi:hypothetical protein J6590_054195 [Homalodisca vitripennis]|nr:hypothetical protein J6590_054195 [Homalodisca vitripennis]